MTVDVRPLDPEDEPAAEALVDQALAGRHQVRAGEVRDVLALPGFAAYAGRRLVGLATWGGDAGAASELAALAVAQDFRGQGVAAALLEAVTGAAARAGTTVIWLITTNDNLDALRLYQRHRFRLVELRAGAVDRARATKPTIPALGYHGIPLRDELVLERALVPC